MIKTPKIYFACSIRGGGDMSSYATIVAAIRRAGGTVLSEMFVEDAIVHGGSQLPVDQIYQRDIAMIKDANAIVAEVSNPSLGVGYELAYGEQLGKPILCLFNTGSEKKLSAMIEGNNYNVVARYNGTDPTSATVAIESFLQSL